VKTLYVVATPIGNLGDISRRGADILRQVDLIACEDTRQTIKLLNHLGIRTPLTSYHDFSEEQKAATIADKLDQGQDVALVSDAGTPAIADPGYRLIRLCRSRGFAVVPIPGPNAAVTALSASGLPSNEFAFFGFLPARKMARRQKLESVVNLSCTLIFYEAPHRIQAALEDIQHILGDRETCVARELTKIHEQFLIGTLSEIRPAVKPLGEFVIIVSGATQVQEVPMTREHVLRRLGMTRNQLYDLFFKKDDGKKTLE
jgi:16S rRNA (cytidine1402-2'-O)-methyltransferase